jgi:hypothetical protein
MPDFGYGGYGHRDRFFHRHHRHDWGLPPPLPPLDLDPLASAVNTDPDMGCDPYTPGFRVFGDDGTTTADDASDDGGADDGSGGQGGVLDATTQVAQGVADMIAPSAQPERVPWVNAAPMAVPPPFYHHRHHRFAPRLIEPRAPLSRWELERIERERLRRLELERGRRRFYGEPEPEFGDAWGQQTLFPLNRPNPNPAFRFGPNGYRPRGPGFRHGPGGYGHPHHHFHPHPGMGPQGMGPQGMGRPMPPGQLPPGTYQATCQQCTYDGQTLSCMCKDTSGNLQQTSMQTDPMGSGGVSNHNGQLVQAQT